MQANLSSTLASMGSALPYALAAKHWAPGRPVIALLGDGAMQMNGINELITVANSWRQWRDPRLVVLVLNNRDLNEVTWEIRETEGDPRFASSQDVPDFPYARYAELLGLRSIVVDDPNEVGAAWDRALSADRPFLIEARVDPAIPLLAPRLETEAWERLDRGLAREGSDGIRANEALQRERKTQERSGTT
jgi:pyruvate dehydrogenase (quinone)